MIIGFLVGSVVYEIKNEFGLLVGYLFMMEIVDFDELGMIGIMCESVWWVCEYVEEIF